MRWTFPQDRFTYQFGPGTPIYPVATGTTLEVYTDQACSLPADIRDTDGSPLNNQIAIGDDTLLPEFLGPDTDTTGAEVLVLWARPSPGAPSYRLDAQLVQRIDNLDPGQGGGGSGPYIHAQGVPMATWSVTHNLGYFPNVAVVDTTGQEWKGGVFHLDVDRLQIFFVDQLAGTATCS